MSRWAYVNGRFVRHGEAAVHIEDRGYQLADGIYEVWAVMGGRLVDSDGHFERLDRSLGEMGIRPPMSRKALELVLREALRRNRVRHGLLYLQVTRGVARRDHAFPIPAPEPAIVITARSIDPIAAEVRAARGVSVITTPENRWGRCDIKTIGLLPNAMAKTAARDRGAAEAWFVDADGLVTEGASSNAWIVDAQGVLRTRDTTANILRGVTRKAVLGLLGEANIRLDERAFTPEEARNAREAFITGAGALILPVVAIDGAPIGTGKPGPVAQRLRALYIQNAQASNS
ncbi:MAG TPA: D-amino-acid transaminase [Caulobacter sp.]|nr:D-amino-acid transaminase [Caulobacter sp.]